MKDTIIWDLDGTLSDGTHRLHLLPKPEDANLTSGWLAFNQASDGDLPILDNIRLMRSQFDSGFRIIILTGRSDHVMSETQAWLWDHGVKYHRLTMRSELDHRKDIEFKEGALKAIGLDRILCCFDDLEHVAKHIRGMGLTCHLVTHYETKRVDTVSRDERKELQ